jgi:hypothetical protein
VAVLSWFTEASFVCHGYLNYNATQKPTGNVPRRIGDVGSLERKIHFGKNWRQKWYVK